MKAAVCLLLLVAVFARAQNGGDGQEMHYEQAAYSDNAADAQSSVSLDQLPFDADNNAHAESDMPMQEQDQDMDQDQDQEQEQDQETEEDGAVGPSLAEVDSESAEEGAFDDLKTKAVEQLKKHPVGTLSNLAHKVADSINALKHSVSSRRNAKQKASPPPTPAVRPPRITPIRRPRPSVKPLPPRRVSGTARPLWQPRPRLPSPSQSRGGRRHRKRSGLKRPIVTGSSTSKTNSPVATRRPVSSGRSPKPRKGGSSRHKGLNVPRPVTRPGSGRRGRGRRGRERGRGRGRRGREARFPRPPAAARSNGGFVDTLWHSERHDFGPKPYDSRDPEMAKLNLALEAVKEDILSTNKQINDERRWVIAVSKIITSYNTKMKRVEAHIVTLRKEMKQLYKKKKQIENLKLQRMLEAKLKEARDELATLTNSLKHVASKQSELNRSGADLRNTIAGIQAQLAKLRGQQMMKKCKRGFKYSKKAKKCVRRCKKGMKWKGKGKKGRCVPKKGKGKKGKGKKGKKGGKKPKKF